MVTLGVPYTDEEIANAQQAMLDQGTQIEKNLYTDPDFAEGYEADKKAGGRAGRPRRHPHCDAAGRAARRLALQRGHASQYCWAASGVSITHTSSMKQLSLRGSDFSKFQKQGNTRSVTGQCVRW